jgi:hypothetical protein
MFFDLSNIDPDILKRIFYWVVIPLMVLGVIFFFAVFGLNIYHMISGTSLINGVESNANADVTTNFATPGLTRSGGCCLPLCFPLPLFAFGSLPFLGKKRREAQESESESVDG